ncbi:hypothetical protein BD324DRAFT_652505 [Kockovaella imperatae]|uniref:PRELI/MSF1 domain-containing protein n=1 Tax=Kockovaella imperatae TaxID=4999 RepID=A0A1Y1UBJ2_9TREE|nr:hypothetical protein BD324DRAFT_652505 [Kockovaella imperatae]ORX35372.1 hypothetical protein BD324DRAFT_652505 [Kockovaella imperatae]
MSVNLSLAQYVRCLELITYGPNPNEALSSTSPASDMDGTDQPATPPEPGVPGPGAYTTSTLFHQRATIISGFPTVLVARRIEQASIDRFSKNAGVGKQGFEWVLSGGQEPPPKR